jgi:hypothetical protein
MINNTYNSWAAAATLAPRRKNSFWPFFVAIVGVALAILALIYSGGFSAALKFLGVGASSQMEVTLTSADNWLGTGGPDYIIGGAASLQSTGVFTDFPGLPSDPDLTPSGVGLVAPIFNNSADEDPEGTPDSVYISPVLDLSVVAPLITSIVGIDFVPETTEISYAYRSAAAIDDLSNRDFLPLELATTDTSSMKVNTKMAAISQPAERYLQFKFVFGGILSSDVRSAVYAITVQYQDNAEKNGNDLTGEGTGTSGGSNVAQKNISLRYSEVNAPTAASITIISTDLNDPIVYLAEGVNLSERNSLSIETSLTAGAYALKVTALGMKDKIMPFVMIENQLDTQVNAGSFEAGASSSEAVSADLNGDNKVDLLDFTILLGQMR